MASSFNTGSKWIKKVKPNANQGTIINATRASNTKSENLSKYYLSPLAQCNRYYVNQQLEYDVIQIFSKQCQYIPTYFNDPTYSIFKELKNDIINYHKRMDSNQNDVNDLNKITLPNEICYNLKTMNNSQKKAMNVRLINDEQQIKKNKNDCFKASLQCYIERNVYETPLWSKKCKEIIDNLCKYYQCDLIVCSMNFYKNGDDFAKFHFDKYKYHKNHSNKPDITIGASFGASRDLSFQSCANRKCQITIKQNNGDIFSFSDKVNEKFRHSILKIPNFNQERISIIIWGKTKRNRYKNKNKTYNNYQKNKRNYGSSKSVRRW